MIGIYNVDLIMFLL